MQEPSTQHTVAGMPGEVHLAVLLDGNVLMKEMEHGWVLPTATSADEVSMRSCAACLVQDLTNIEVTTSDVFHLFSSQGEWKAGSTAAVYLWDAPEGLEDVAGHRWMRLEEVSTGCADHIDAVFASSMSAGGIKTVRQFREIIRGFNSRPRGLDA